MYKIESEQDGGSGPKGPNFGLVVTLAVVALFVCFGLAFLFIPSFAHMVHPVKQDAHPTSQVYLVNTGTAQA